MFKIFFEKKFVFYNTEKYRKDEMYDELGGAMERGEVSDASAARDIMERLNSLREDMRKSSLLNDDDQKIWQKRLDEVKEKPTHAEVIRLEQEFRQQQVRIKTTVDQYSTILKAKKEAALAVDKENNVDTEKEYIDWLMAQNDEGKEKALAALDAELQPKIELRKKIIRLNPQLKKDVLKMRGHEMEEKLKELERVEKNVEKARRLLERDSRYSSDFEAQLKHFADLPPDVQEKRLTGYEKYYLEPRKKITDLYESIPEQIRKFPDLPAELRKNFYKLRLKEKQDYVEKLQDFTEEKFIKSVNSVHPATWSETTKRFAIQSFMQIDNLPDKAKRLAALPDFIKAEQKLTEEYKKLSRDLKDMPDYSLNKWERLKFEEKQQMLKKMEAEAVMRKNFTQMLDNKKRQNVISERTYQRMIRDYNETSIEERLRYIREFNVLMRPREDLIKNFMSLSKETQNNFKEEFINRGYKARLEIFKQAREFEAKNSAKSGKKTEAGNENNENMPKPLNSPELKAIIDNLQMQADLYEDQGNLEKALGIHESIINLDPKNSHSLEKIKDLKAQTEAMEAVSATGTKLQLDNDLNQEIDNLALLEYLLRDKKNQIAKAGGAEDASRQHSHLGDDAFKHRLHESIAESSGGRKILGKDGGVKDVYTIDVEKFGRDPAEDRVYDIKKRQQELADNENFTESRMVDGKTGKILSFEDAENKLEIRKRNAARKIAGLKRAKLSDAEDFVDERISKAA